MRKVIRKTFFIWDFKKEEQWLCDMSAKGLALVAVSYGTYTFEESVPGEYDVRLELLENLPTHPESEAYIRFVEETGAQYVGAILRWVYFRKKKTDGAFELHSDYDSRIKHVNRMLALASVLTIAPLFVGGCNLALFFLHMRETPLQVANLVVGLLCVGVGLLIGFGTIFLFRKKRKLYKEKQVFE